MRLAGLELVKKPFRHGPERFGPQVELGDARAQDRVGQPAIILRAEIGERDLRQGNGAALRANARNHLARRPEQIFGAGPAAVELPPSWSLGTFTLSKKVSQKGE